MSSNIRPLAFGKNNSQSRKWAVISFALFILSLILFSAVKVFNYPALHMALWWEGYATILLVGVMIQAFLNDGILLCWGMVFAAVLGAVLNYGGIAITGGPPSFVRLIALAIMAGSIGAITLGTIGFIIGAGANRILYMR